MNLDENQFLKKRVSNVAILACIAAFSICFLAIFNVVISIPSDSTIKGCLVTSMYKVNLCPGGKDYARIKEISPFLKNAILVSEDSGFYQHSGFDFSEMKESFRKNLEEKTFARGGSTITQQLAKNMFLTSEKTILRKLKEAVITYKIEKALTKDEILERYLNVVEFAENVFGVKPAAQYYFHKTPKELNVLESSFLAFLLPSPEKYSVSFKKKTLTSFAQKRLAQIVERLYLFERISFEDYSVAKVNLPNFPWTEPLVKASLEDIEKPTTEGLERFEEDKPESTDEEYTDAIDWGGPLKFDPISAMI